MSFVNDVDHQSLLYKERNQPFVRAITSSAQLTRSRKERERKKKKKKKKRLETAIVLKKKKKKIQKQQN